MTKIIYLVFVLMFFSGCQPYSTFKSNSSVDVNPNLETGTLSSIDEDKIAPTIHFDSNSINGKFLFLNGRCESGLNILFTGDIENSPVSINCTANSFSANLVFSNAYGAKNVVATQTDLSGNIGNARGQFQYAEVLGSGSLGDSANIILLRHSTGGRIYNGGGVPALIRNYNSDNNKSYNIEALEYPSNRGYGWNNYPYDYWNIWVNHGDVNQYLGEDTLNTLTQNYNLIVFKHCYPVSDIEEANGEGSVSDDSKTIPNYKLQYAALKEKMHEFPNNRFLIWTGAARVQSSTNEDTARRAREFFNWVKNEWDEPGDNIYIWDLWQLETNGGLYLLGINATSSSDSHPNSSFSRRVAPFLVNRITDVIEGRGDNSPITGEYGELP